MSSLPAGWYKDPADPTTQRYWDGEGWLGKALPADAVPPDGPPPPEEPEPEPEPPAPVPPARAAAPAGAPAWQQLPPGGPAQAPPPGWQPGMPLPYPVQARPHGLELAGFGQRLAARLVDIVAVALLNAVVNGWFIYQFVQEFAPYYQAALEDAQAGRAFSAEQPVPSGKLEVLIWVIPVIATLLWLLYEAPAVANRGQTLGKRLAGIKVMAVESTAPLGFGRAFRRWARLGLWTPFWSCAGLGLLMQFIDSISPLFDQRLRQALHDKTARTVVVSFPHGTAQPVDAPPEGPR